MARITATIAAGLLAALCVSAQSSEVTIAGYTTAECQGTPALQQTFSGGPDVCQSFTYEGATIYGKVYCDNGQPSATFCGTDSTCVDCTTNLAAAGNNVCGDGYNVFTSAKSACGSSVGNSASSNAVGVVGIAAAAAASVAALL